MKVLLAVIIFGAMLLQSLAEEVNANPGGAIGIEDRDAFAEAVKKLGDKEQTVRDDGAAKIRAILTHTPTAINYHGSAYRQDKLKAAEPGMTMAEFQKATGGAAEGGTISGDGKIRLDSWALDDYWRVVTDSTFNDNSLCEVIALESRAVAIAVDPSNEFSGRWKVYFPNGQEADVQVYANGKREGSVIGYYPDGGKQYEGQYHNGEKDGTWKHWHPNGKEKSQDVYVNGEFKEHLDWYENGKKKHLRRSENGKVGWANWDDKGKLKFSCGVCKGEKDQE